VLRVDAVRDRVTPVLQVSEIRTIAADELWISPAQGRDTAALHFTWVPDTAAVLPAVAAVESALEPFGTRPHWGKVFGTAPAKVASLWPHLPEFANLTLKHDPDGKFRNAMPTICQCVGPARQPCTTGLVSTPTPGIRHSATVPGRIWIAPGVPVEMMSPGYSGITALWKLTRNCGE
jgi:hypothetical protein